MELKDIYTKCDSDGKKILDKAYGYAHEFNLEFIDTGVILLGIASIPHLSKKYIIDLEQTIHAFKKEIDLPEHGIKYQTTPFTPSVDATFREAISFGQKYNKGIVNSDAILYGLLKTTHGDITLAANILIRLGYDSTKMEDLQKKLEKCA